MHFVVEFQDWIQEPKDESISSVTFKRNFETKVESDLHELEKLNEEDYEKSCRYLNYIIDNIRELFFSSKNIRIPDVARKYLWDNQIEGNLKELISTTTTNKCQRNRINNSQKDRDLRLKLHNYCDERDKRLRNLQGKENNEENCYEFMVWVKQNKDSITRDYHNNMSGVRNRAGFFKISNTCDLNKFDSLFPDLHCSSKIYRKDDVLREPKEILKQHEGGGDQNTVDERNQLKSKEKKHKGKEKKPTGVLQEIYGVGRKPTESFFSPKTSVVEEAVNEYTTDDCADGKCVVLDCSKDDCNLIEVSSDDEEPEKENLPNSIDSSPKECEEKQCTEEHKNKSEYQETDQVGTATVDRSKKKTKGSVKGSAKHQRNNGEGSRGVTNEGTYSSRSRNGNKKTEKNRSQRPKKNRDSGGDENKKENRLKGKSGNVISDSETKKKRRKGSPSIEEIPYMQNGDHNIKGEKEIEDEMSSTKQETHEFETDSDLNQDIEGTIESRPNDDGINSIFGIPFPNFSDYTDFDLSDFSLSNIPYPSISIPFFPRSPRIYKGLYGGISRIPQGPTHINIYPRKAVDTASEIVNKVRDKMGSGEKDATKEIAKRKEDSSEDGERGQDNKVGSDSDINDVGKNSSSDSGSHNRSRPNENKDDMRREKGNTYNLNKDTFEQGDGDKTSNKESKDGPNHEGSEKDRSEEDRNFTIEQEKESDGVEESNDSKFQDFNEKRSMDDLVSSTDSGMTNELNNNLNDVQTEIGKEKDRAIDDSQEETQYNTVTKSDNSPNSETNEIQNHVFEDGTSDKSDSFISETSTQQIISNEIRTNHEEPVSADIEGNFVSTFPGPIKEEVPVTYDGKMCEGIIYTDGGSPCKKSSNFIGIKSSRMGPSSNGGNISNEISRITTVSTMGSHRSLNHKSELMMSQVLDINSVEASASLPQGISIPAQQHSSLAQSMSERGGSGQTDSKSQEQKGKETEREDSTSVGPTSNGRTKRSATQHLSKEASIITTKGLNGGTPIINKTHQSFSSFFDFSSLTKNILIALAIFGVIFLFIFSNKHSSLGMFNKKKKKRRRKSVLINEDNMNAKMLERYEDIDDENNKFDEDDCNDNELNKRSLILPYEKEEEDVYKIEDQIERIGNEKIEREKNKYINVEHISEENTYDYNNIYNDEDIKSVDVMSTIKEKKERWKWKTIIEIQLVVIEEIHNEEWDMNKHDFLSICINEFMNEKNRKCLYNEDDDFNSTDVMIKGQTFLWNKWMERHKYILDQWKEEESFEYLKNDWKREEEEYMKKIYKDLLLSLRGDTYNMSQRQKIIWKRWIAKHPYRIREKIIDQWFHKLFEEINKNNPISDEIIDILLNDYIESDKNCEYIYNMSEKKEKLKLNLWIQIYMCVMEEAEKDSCIKKKETYVDTLIENIKDKEYIIDIVEDIKKDIHTLPINQSLCKWKKEKWFEELKNNWKVEENKRLNYIPLKNNNDIYKDVIEKSVTYIEKNILHKLLEEINFKWIDEDNENDWLKVIENNSKDENNIIYINKKNNENTNIYINKNINKEENKMKCYEIKYMFDNMTLQGNTEDYHENNFLEEHKYEDNKKNNTFNNEFSENPINQNKEDINRNNDQINIMFNQHNNEWIQVIKLHLDLIDECKKKEWEENKYDFLDICIEEYIKNENKDNSRNILEDEIFSMNKNIMWDTFIETHRYILEKWKREEWFHNLKKEWEEEILNYLNSSKNRNDESNKNCNESNTNFMIEEEKIVFRKWINKHTEELKDCYEGEKNPFLEVEINKKKKNYKLIAWLQIHMMILERFKEDEFLRTKELFIDICIEGIKKGYLCKNNDIIIQMLNKLKSDIYNSCEYLLSQQKDDKKKKKEEWYKKLKKYWMDKGSTHFNFLRQKDNYETILDIIKQSMLIVYNNMFIKNYDDQNFQWIDEDNEKDWLKFVNIKKEKRLSHNICEHKPLKDIKNKMSILRDIYKTKEMLTFYSEEI
ncbi:surface-associated interspersed protein 1.2 putative [Plasmodium sp. gorilla clade G2]|uniref:surface-associated interspersed protein 1.2 putative n=1 Tax=Plasmodium sp. gorilla clade G2 TaxID=880535 RepID=UPI000D227FEE|nr:surface-associated interspersed protein 1.2 putative [Plasmodium sp. gorilla clade G2]SOV10282.1 surface-associated interspersed protein 1.2 putative [Plasmodium sp. gorilla clade G2]